MTKYEKLKNEHDEEENKQTVELEEIKQHSDEDDITTVNLPRKSSALACTRTCVGCALCVSTTILGITTVAALVVYLRGHQPTPPIGIQKDAFNFTTPYGNGGKLCIFNLEAHNKNIYSFSFKTNAGINEKPWSDLSPWASTLSQRTVDDITYEYTLTPNAPILLEANTVKCMNYNINSTTTLGPMPVGMNPIEINVEFAETGLASIPPLNSMVKAAPESVFKSTVYYPNYARYDRALPVSELPIEKIHQINYAFAQVDQQGNVISADSYADQMELPTLGFIKQQNPQLATRIAFGGWDSYKFFAVLDDNAIKNFATQVEKTTRQLQLNGITLDLEWTATDHFDSEKYMKIVRAVRAALPKEKTLTLSIMPSVNVVNQLSKEQYQELVNLGVNFEAMLYDYHGPWSAQSGFNAPMVSDDSLNINATLNALRDRGIPNSSIHFGVPAYARCVTVAEMGNTFGFNQTVIGPASGQYASAPGVFDYKCFENGDCGSGQKPPSDMTCQSADSETMQRVCSSTSTNTFCSVESTETVHMKAEWAKQNGYQGAFVWDISTDASTQNNSLIGAMFNATQSATQNQGSHQATASDVIAAWKDLLPTEFLDAIVQAAKTGVALALLKSASQDFLNAYLPQLGFKKESIEKIADGVNLFATAAVTGSGYVAATSMGLKYAAEFSGMSKQQAQTTSSVAAVGMVLATTNISVPALISLTVGALIITKTTEKVYETVKNSADQFALQGSKKIGQCASRFFKWMKTEEKPTVNSQQVFTA